MLMQKGRIRVENPLAWAERAAEQMREAPPTNEMVRTGLGLPLPHADTANQKRLGLGETSTLANR